MNEIDKKLVKTIERYVASSIEHQVFTGGKVESIEDGGDDQYLEMGIWRTDGQFSTISVSKNEYDYYRKYIGKYIIVVGKTVEDDHGYWIGTIAKRLIDMSKM